MATQGFVSVCLNCRHCEQDGTTDEMIHVIFWQFDRLIQTVPLVFVLFAVSLIGIQATWRRGVVVVADIGPMTLSDVAAHAKHKRALAVFQVSVFNVTFAHGVHREFFQFDRKQYSQSTQV